MGLRMVTRARAGKEPVEPAGAGSPARQQRKRAHGAREAAAPLAGGYDFAQLPIGPPPAQLPSTIALHQPGDRSEREAERAGDRATQRLNDAGAGFPAELSAVAPSLQRAAAEPGAGGAAAAPAPGGLIVEDDAQALTAGQMRKSAFLAELRAAACTAADQELARAGRSTQGCPYVGRALDYYAGRSAGQVERAIQKFASDGAAAARTARDLIPPVSARLARGVRSWVATGMIPADVPEELRTAALSGSPLDALGGALASVAGSVAGAVGGALSAVGSLFSKAGPGGARGGVDHAALAGRLGPGRPFGGGERTRMESAFGHSFAHVRVHDDVGAAGLSRDLNARAFTVGEHVAFGAGEYRPGTPVGDALMAHELAHVVQQAGGDAGGARAPAPADALDTVERDADGAAADAVVSLWGRRFGLAGDRRARPRLRSGLRLSRCSSHKAAPGSTKVDNDITDAPYSWTSSFDVNYTADEIRVLIQPKLAPDDGVSEADVKNVKTTAAAGVTTYWDNKFTLTDNASKKAYSLRVRVEFVDDNEHYTIKLHPGNDRGNRRNWYVGWGQIEFAHEIGHQLGLKDEYIEAEAPARKDASAPGVKTDNSLMGDFYSEGIGAAEVKQRHGETIGSEIGAATGRAFTIAKKKP
jgi:hypothetical protein